MNGWQSISQHFIVAVDLSSTSNQPWWLLIALAILVFGFIIFEIVFCTFRRRIQAAMTKKSVVLSAVFCLFLTGLCGCTAPLAVQGLGSTSPVAFNSIGRGKGDSFWLARYDDVVQATLRAGLALSLKLEKKENGKDQTVFHYVDGKEKKLYVLIERRTETMTYARFDVGSFGSRAMGKLMVRQIIFEITKADAFLQNWSPTEEDSSGNSN